MSGRVPPRVVRRLVLDPLWLPAAALLAVLFGVVILVSALLAPVTPHRRVLRLACLACVYLVVDVTMLLGGLALWLRQPLPRRDEEKWQTRHCALLLWGLTVVVEAGRALLGFDVVIDEPPVVPTAGVPLIVLARHAGPGDSFTLVRTLMSLHGRRPRVVLKRTLQWDPGLDVVLTRLSACFLPSHKGGRAGRTQRVAEVAACLAPGDALLLFPEGGNWTPRRHRRAVVGLLRAGKRRAAQRAREHSRVLPPRPAGTLACLAARPDADVLVIAHRGLDTLTSLRQIWDALPLRGRPMVITWWSCPAASVPRDAAGAEAWLNDQWARVDAWVAA